MTAPVLGVDPGRTGGACLLDGDGRTALATWSWSPDGDGYALWTWVAADDQVRVRRWRAHLRGVGRCLAQETGAQLGAFADLTLCVEGLFVHPSRVHGVIELAEAAGELLGALRELEAEPLRPRAAVWRPAILGIPANTEAAKAEAVAVHAVRLGLVRGLPELTDGHVAEAACIARWGWVAAREASQLDLVGRGR